MIVKIQDIEKWIFYVLIIIFFIIPEPFQKIFRISLGVFFVAYGLLLMYNKKFFWGDIIKILLIWGLLVLSILNSSFHTAAVNVALSTVGFFIVTQHKIEIKKDGIFDVLYYLSLISLLIQLIIFEQNGRPSLGYEINLSGAYLFLFFLLSQVFKKKIGVVFVIAAALLVLSRLLIVAIACYYLAVLFRRIIPNFIFSINFNLVYSCTLVLFILFNYWFLSSVEITTPYHQGFDRVHSFNDGSNKLRFLSNKHIIESLFVNLDHNLVFGYGNVSRVMEGSAYLDKYQIMPHNELFVSIVEFGYLFTTACFFFVLAKFSVFFKRTHIALLLPIFIYTLILWVNFMLIPSFEMIFIYLLLCIHSSKNKEKNKITSHV